MAAKLIYDEALLDELAEIFADLALDRLLTEALPEPDPQQVEECDDHVV